MCLRSLFNTRYWSTYASIDFESGHLSILAWNLILLICRVRLSLSMVRAISYLSLCMVDWLTDCCPGGLQTFHPQHRQHASTSLPSRDSRALVTSPDVVITTSHTLSLSLSVLSTDQVDNTRRENIYWNTNRVVDLTDQIIQFNCHPKSWLADGEMAKYLKCRNVVYCGSY